MGEARARKQALEAGRPWGRDKPKPPQTAEVGGAVAATVSEMATAPVMMMAAVGRSYMMAGMHLPRGGPPRARRGRKR